MSHQNEGTSSAGVRNVLNIFAALNTSAARVFRDVRRVWPDVATGRAGWPVGRPTTKRPNVANVGRWVPSPWRLALLAFGFGEGWVKLVRNRQQQIEQVVGIKPRRTPTGFQFRLHGGGYLAKRIRHTMFRFFVLHGCGGSYLAAANWPRSVLVKRASFPLTLISRMIAL